MLRSGFLVDHRKQYLPITITNIVLTEAFFLSCRIIYGNAPIRIFKTLIQGLDLILKKKKKITLFVKLCLTEMTASYLIKKYELSLTFIIIILPAPDRDWDYATRCHTIPLTAGASLYYPIIRSDYSDQ